jgi:hypothetical protein
MKLNKTFLFISLSLYISNNYAGYPVTDLTLIQTTERQGTGIIAAINAMNTAVNTSINTMNTSVSNLLYQVGTAVTQSGDKVVSAIEANGSSQRNFMVSQATSSRMLNAKIAYSVPSNICSESASAKASSVKNSSATSKTKTRSGGGGTISNKNISQYYNSPQKIPEIDSAISAKIHSEYCDKIDYASYGGSQACPQVSQMAGADKRIDTLLFGAGEENKKPDLTFNQKQIDAGYIYIQNSARRSISPALLKGESDTVAGSQYIGFMNQYQAVLSAALDPLEQLLADSMPNDNATQALKEALKSPSAVYYWNQTASLEALNSGKVSAREYEAFEIGRRYANPHYVQDLQEMSTENLMREQIRVSAQTNWMLLELKNEIRKGNVINGLQLASTARQEYTPILSAQYKKVSGYIGASSGK